MKRPTPIGLALGLVAFSVAAPVRAQTAGDSALRPTLHVDDSYRNCFFDLHPELTQAEFDEFTGELGSILRPRQLSDPATLGKGRFDLGLDYSRTGIDDAKGAWNNTMSHPRADHYLGDSIQFPRLVARYGLSDRVDLGATGALGLHSNWGLASLEAKIALMRQGRSRPVSIALRPSLTSLIGPREVWVGNAALDLSVSRVMGRFAPYLGFSSNAALGVEKSKDVDLDYGKATSSPFFAGVAYHLPGLVLSAEFEHGKVNSLAIRTSTRF